MEFFVYGKLPPVSGPEFQALLFLTSKYMGFKVAPSLLFSLSERGLDSTPLFGDKNQVYAEASTKEGDHAS
jgi:hypothetical protein